MRPSAALARGTATVPEPDGLEAERAAHAETKAKLQDALQTIAGLEAEHARCVDTTWCASRAIDACMCHTLAPPPLPTVLPSICPSQVDIPFDQGQGW